jgi:hypothetical protein
MSSAREAWEDVLTTLERDLAALQAAIDDLDQPTPATTFAPPADLGPMPADLARRALSLAAAYDTAVKRAEEEAARVAEELRRLPRGHAEQQPATARVEYRS